MCCASLEPRGNGSVRKAVWSAPLRVFLNRYLLEESCGGEGAARYSGSTAILPRPCSGYAEMKKTGSRRGSEDESGTSSAVLEAPEESLAPVEEARVPWQGSAPAPAGALQRGYGHDGGDAGDMGGFDSGYGAAEEEYVPRRGALRVGVRGALRTVAGRVLLGVAAVVVLGAIGVAAAAVRSFALQDPRFVLGSSDDIQIEGAEHLTRDQVLSVFGADLERNIFRLSLEERKADLERLPWVEHATVMRLLPNNLRVSITERTPVAFVRQGTQIGLVDASGVLLDMPADAAGDPQYSFPVLTGLSASQPLQARAERMLLYHDFMAALGGAKGHLADSLSEVDVTDPEDVKALIATGNSDILVHFGEQQFLQRYQEFERHLPEWKQTYPKLASADMRYEGQVVLEMQGGAAGATGAAGAMGAAGATGAAAGVATATVAGDHLAAGAAAGAPAAMGTGEGGAASGRTDRRATAGTMASSGGTGSGEIAGMKAAVAKTPPAVRAAVVKAPSARAATPRKAVARMRATSGKDAANERVFAALAAAHKAALAKAASAGRSKAAASTAGGETR